MEERDFDVLDIAYVIRNGRCIQEGVFVPELRQHKYTFRENVDGADLEITFALDADRDLIEAPLLILVTGVFKNKSGKRKKTF